MSLEAESGGPSEVEKAEHSPKESKFSSKRILAIVLAFVLVFTSFGVWYFLVRPWSIQEVAEKVTGDPYAPGFEPYLAGTSIHVSGRVTDFDVNHTTLGPLTVIELDNFNLMHLVDWNEPDFKLGDIISRKVDFEWSRFNDDIRVFSPQLDFPWMHPAFAVPVVMAAVSYIEGFCLLPKNDPMSDDVILQVVLRMNEGFPLGLFNASLKKGVGSWAVEYIDVTGGYEDNPQLDYLGTLEDRFGENQTMEFVDANSNDLFDDGDYFRLSLTRPPEDSGVLTYFLQINNGGHRSGYGVLKGLSYIAMKSRGVLWAFDTEAMNPVIPSGDLALRSEAESSGSVSAEIVISEMRGPQVEIHQAGCTLSQEAYLIDWEGLEDGGIHTEDDYSVSFTDSDQDGVMSNGDYFVLSGLSNWTDYRFSVQLTYGGYLSTSWTTGIGVFSGNLPVIEWNEPLALDLPVNHSFKLQIGRMYGVPGVLLEEEDERMVVDIVRDGVAVLTFSNLTSSFNHTSSDLNVTFEDADGNGYVNSGDYFICINSGPAQLEIILGYVNLYGHRDHPQPLISWPLSWQTG